MEVRRLSQFIGAEVRGLDVSSELDAESSRRIHDAWFEHLVLVFRGQTLSDDQFVDFSRQFGDLELAPIGEAANPASDGIVPDLPTVNVVSNVVEDGVKIGVLGAGEAICIPTCRIFLNRRRPVYSTLWRCCQKAATPAFSTCMRLTARSRQICEKRLQASRRSTMRATTARVNCGKDFSRSLT